MISVALLTGSTLPFGSPSCTQKLPFSGLLGKVSFKGPFLTYPDWWVSYNTFVTTHEPFPPGQDRAVSICYDLKVRKFMGENIKRIESIIFVKSSSKHIELELYKSNRMPTPIYRILTRFKIKSLRLSFKIRGSHFPSLHLF